MAKTGAGWQVEPPTSKNLTKIYAGGHWHTVKRGAGGNISRAMAHLITELNKIERASEAGWDGTYNYRPVRENAGVWSEHSAGVGYDHNASQHPRGGSQYVGWSPEQVRAIRAFLATPKGKAFKWGADFTKTKDAMHFELRNPAVWLTKRRLFAL